MSQAVAPRFPPPEFTETSHVLPVPTAPGVPAVWFQYLDVAVLIAALVFVSWLLLRRRSRAGVVATGIFSILYFGFWKKGCICSIGSIQNIAQALSDSSFGVPLTVLFFGFTPLIFALFFGRVFCAAVCPHGALQDLVLLKPIKVPAWLDHSLRMLAWIYLGLAVVFAVTGGGFIICQYDPFVPLFRLSGSLTMVLLGVSLLVVGIFVGRPYCRFLCPYGVLLGLASSVSKWRVRITPDTCTQCRLCEESCPFGAIEKSTVEAPVRPQATDQRRLLLLLVLLPILIATGAGLGGMAGGALARKHRVVNLAERLQLENTGVVPDTTDASATFRAGTRSLESLDAEARALRHRYTVAARWCGAWIGLVVGLKLLSLAILRKRPDYEANQSRCLGCARCYRYCPQELQRLGLPVPAPPATAVE